MTNLRHRSKAVVQGALALCLASFGLALAEDHVEPAFRARAESRFRIAGGLALGLRSSNSEPAVSDRELSAGWRSSLGSRLDDQINLCYEMGMEWHPLIHDKEYLFGADEGVYPRTYAASLGPYGRIMWGPLFVKAGLAYAWLDSFSFRGSTYDLNGSSVGGSLSVGLELLPVRWIGLEISLGYRIASLRPSRNAGQAVLTNTGSPLFTDYSGGYIGVAAMLMY